MRGLLLIIALAQAANAAVTGDVRLRTHPPSSSSERAYQAAARAFQAGHWATADRWLEEFVRLHPESTHRSRAVLLRAQALYQSGEFAKAATQISKGENAAAELADAYLYWKAECRIRLEQFEAASAHLRELLREHPESPHALAGMVALATVSARKKEWGEVVQLLRPTEGKFKLLAKLRAHSSWAQEGRLLLAQALYEEGDWNAAAEELGVLPATTDLRREWRRLFLLAQIENQAGKPEDALRTTARISKLARQTGQTNQLAQVYCFRAGLHEAANNAAAALREYAQLQSATLPGIHRHEGFLRAARLQFKQGNFSEAIATLDELAKLNSAAHFAGMLHCLAGELEWLRHQRGHTGALANARSRFALAEQSTEAAIRGRVRWGNGWCHLAGGNAQSARDAWGESIELLGESALAPWARMQLAQAQARQGQHELARAALQDELPEALLDLARWVRLRSALALGDYPAADSLLKQLRARNNALADEGLLNMAQAHLDAGEAPEARLVLARLRQESPGSPLEPDADLEAIRGQIAKENWTGANEAYQVWLKKNKTHPLRARVLLDHAWAQSMGGQSTNELAAFELVVKLHPETEQAYLAKMWLADNAFNSGTNHLGAEKIYKSITSQTNAPVALRQRATLMAGRAAMVRQGVSGFGAARTEFTRLINAQDTPARIKSEAHFALGDLTMLEIGVAGPDTTAKLTNATNSFYNVIQASPTNALAARAWGRIGDCCLQASAKEPGYREHARLAYGNAIAIKGPLPVALKSQCLLGLAKVLERQAQGADRDQKLAEAVDHLLEVVEGKNLRPGEVQDAYWRGQSGLMLMDLLGQLGKPREGLRVCNLLIQDYPAMRNGLEAQKQRFLNQLSRQK